jgi:hypothetical protein
MKKSHQSSVISHQSSVISHQFSVFSLQSSENYSEALLNENDWQLTADG